MSESVFIPRPIVRERLDEIIERSTKGQAQLVWFLGETGMGKSWLLKDYLAAKGASFITSSVVCSAPIGNQSTTILKPYQPLKDVFEDLLANQSDTKRRLTLVKNISLTVLACIPVVGELAYGIKEIRRDLSEYKTGEREVDFTKFVQEYYHTLVRMAEDAPVIIAIDDVQWVDAMTLVALRQFFESPQFSASPVTFILSGRQDEIESSSDVREFYHYSTARPYSTEVAMMPFSTEEIRAYFTFRFPEAAPDQDVILWFEQKTGGNPLFLHSYIQHLSLEKILQPDGTLKGDLQSYRGLPAEVKGVTNWLMKALTEDDLMLLLTASVLGSEFSLHEIAHLMQAPALEIIRRLRKIKALFGVCEPVGYRLVNGKESTVYRFTQHVIQTALYNELTAEEREQLHREVAQYLNSIRLVSGDNPDVLNSLASALMLHAHLGRQPEIEYDSILLKARHTPELLDDETVMERLAALAPELGLPLKELEQAYRRALQLAPLMTRFLKHDGRVPFPEEEDNVEHLSEIILKAMAHIERGEAAEAVQLLNSFVQRQKQRASAVHPLVWILHALALFASNGDAGKALRALHTAAGQTSHPTYAALAGIGVALFEASELEILKALKAATHYEGRHEGLLQRLVRFIIHTRFGGAEEMEQFLRDRGVTLPPMKESKVFDFLYPKTAGMLAEWVKS